MSKRDLSSPGVTIARASPADPDVRALIEALDAYLVTLYPAESNHLDPVEVLTAPNVRFLVARRDGVALGCGALKITRDHGELKRMYVAPEARGTGLGAQILAALEDLARTEGLPRVRLETGVSQVAAIALYKGRGYREIPAFAPYHDDPLSVFMEKRL